MSASINQRKSDNGDSESDGREVDDGQYLKATTEGKDWSGFVSRADLVGMPAFEDVRSGQRSREASMGEAVVVVDSALHGEGR